MAHSGDTVRFIFRGAEHHAPLDTLAEGLRHVAPLVVGVDPSMTCTGVVSSTGRVQQVRSKGTKADSLRTKLTRLEHAADAVAVAVLADGRPDLVVIEGPSYSSKGSSTHDIAGMWWLVVERILGMSLPLAVAAPSARMKYATGKGNAAKDQVLAAVVKRYPDFEITDNNVADALVLCALGCEHLGRPLANVPQLHRDATAKVAWPEGS